MERALRPVATLATSPSNVHVHMKIEAHSSCTLNPQPPLLFLATLCQISCANNHDMNESSELGT